MISKKIGIVGGGPGGLMTALLLQRRVQFPCQITIFEAAGRLGGKIVSPQFNSAPVRYEAGAAELYDYSRIGPDPLRELIAQLGLSTTAMDGQTIVIDDRVLKTPLDLRRAYGEATWRALKAFNRRARAAISPAEYYESDWKADNDDPLSRESFREVLLRIPDERARRYVEVMLHSDLATEPHLTNAMYGLQNYLMNEPDYMRLYSIDGGLEMLPRAIAQQLKAEVRLNTRVMRVERADFARFKLLSRNKHEVHVDEFDYVVVALPNNWIPAIAWGDEKLADAMDRHHVFYDRPAHYLRVSILFDHPFWRDQIDESYFMLDAFGGCCVYDESRRTNAGRHGVLGWLIAGEAALSMSNYDNDALVEAVLDTLPTSLRYRREYFIEGRVHRWVGTVNGLPGGFPAREPDSRHQPEPEQYSDLFVVGDYLFDSTINGVLDSADVVAEWICEDVAEDMKALAEVVTEPASPDATPPITASTTPLADAS